jgi:hypothetical protein
LDATTPQTVYEGEERLFGWTLEEATLYALLEHGTSFELVSCPLDRCRSERSVLYRGPKLAAEGSSGSELVLVDGWLYWSVKSDEVDSLPGGVLGCPVGGCEKPSLVVSEFYNGGGDLAASSPYVYWSDTRTHVDTTSKRRERSLWRLRSGEETAELVQAMEVEETARLAVREEHAYFTDQAGTTVSRVRVDGSGEVEVVAADNRINGLAVARDGLYYSTQILTGQIVQCPLSGCTAPASVLVANQRWPSAVGITDDEAFWLVGRGLSSASTASLESCKLPACAPVTERARDFPSNLATLDNRRPFAVNRDSVVWMETFHNVGCALRRLAR